MSKAQRTENSPVYFETREKAKEYEPMADWLLKDGQVLAYNEVETGFDREDYRDMDPYEKFQVLVDFYNDRRNSKGRDQRYSLEEMLDHVESILEEPEGIKSEVESEGREMLKDQDYPEVKETQKANDRTGSPGDTELRKVVRRLETSDEKEDWVKYTGLEKA